MFLEQVIRVWKTEWTLSEVDCWYAIDSGGIVRKANSVTREAYTVKTGGNELIGSPLELRWAHLVEPTEEGLAWEGICKFTGKRMKGLRIMIESTSGELLGNIIRIQYLDETVLGYTEQQAQEAMDNILNDAVPELEKGTFSTRNETTIVIDGSNVHCIADQRALSCT